MPYARGDKAWGECARSGKRVRLNAMVEDGQLEGMLVAPEWYEPKHPLEIPQDVDDPVALAEPAPEISIPAVVGDDGMSQAQYALSFNSVNQGLTLPAAVPLSSQFLSVEAWVTINAFKDFNNLVANHWINSGWILFAQLNGSMSFSVAQSGIQFGSGFVGSGVPGQRYHLVGVYDGSAIRFYRNMIAAVPGVLVGATLDTGFALVVAQAGNCLLDGLRIYNRALSATEVAEHFAGIYRNESGLIGFWPLDEASGTSAADLSGNGNNGVLANGPSRVTGLLANRSIRLRTEASAVNDAYTGMNVRIVAGAGLGQERRIVGYNGAGRLAYVDPPWSVNTDDTTQYQVYEGIAFDAQGRLI